MIVYTGSGSSADIKHQHKVEKRVHCARQNCLGKDKVMQQVSVAYNYSVAGRQLFSHRHTFELVIAEICRQDVAPVIAVLDETIMVEQRFDAHCDIHADDELELEPICELLTEAELKEQEKLLQLSKKSWSKYSLIVCPTFVNMSCSIRLTNNSDNW